MLGTCLLTVRNMTSGICCAQRTTGKVAHRVFGFQTAIFREANKCCVMHSTDQPLIVIVNDQPLMNQALISLLNIVLERPVVLQANTLAEGISSCRRPGVRLAIMGFELPDAYGLDALKRFRCAVPDVPLMTMSQDDISAIVERILALGVQALLSTRDTQATVSSALTRVMRGERYVSPRFSSVPHPLNQNPIFPDSHPSHGPQRPPLLEGLSPRQREIVTLISQGFTNKEIGRRLNIAHGTVKNYVAEMLNRFHVERRSALALRILDIPSTETTPIDGA